MILPRGSFIFLDNGTMSGHLTEHGRQPVSMTMERIGSKERTLNGTTRAGFVANKHSLDLSWTMVPTTYTMLVDGGKDARWMKDFYDAATGTVDAWLIYDGATTYLKTLITSFSYSIQKRSDGGFDLVDIDMTLEEV